ncbi:pilus assembly protein [Sanguibacter sp. YZGR15]|uniref:Pilus assembly protein n=2 Tax=Sanguibacter suaedae TaxID=2795737 RepID=A0A934MBH8_9MICO|nr:pilus assembly protein [Sanguibacter suaedae]
MLVIFLAVQLALTWHGNSVAGAVARETARVARTGATDATSLAAARDRGYATAAEVGGRTLTDVQITVRIVDADGDLPGPGEDEQYVAVTVTGRAIELVAGLPPRVSATAHAPLETFRGDL